MNIVLIGYRGTGKSTVAKILGQRLGRKVLSTDAEIVKEAKQSIPRLGSFPRIRNPDVSEAARSN
jgi:shikimate kinase